MDSSTTSSSSDAVSPIAFDSAAQLEGVLNRVKEQLQRHIEAASKGKDAGFKKELRAMMDAQMADLLPDMIHQNITVKGMSWEEHQTKSNQVTQPLDTTLLRSTIEAQDAATQMSTLSCAVRINKPALLASQVDSRVSKVVQSGKDKSELLDDQRKRRESRRRLVGGDISAKQETAADLQAVETLLQRANTELVVQSEKAERAADVASDVRRLMARQA